MAAPRRRLNGAAQPRWLTAAQLDTWMSVMSMFNRLSATLGADLQCNADLSYLEYYVMAGLSDQPQRAMRISKLAVLADAELSRISHLIARLERRGFVRRAPDPTDGRYTNAILTDTGFAHLAAAAPGHAELVRELVFDDLDDDALRDIRAGAERIITRIDSRQPSGLT